MSTLTRSKWDLAHVSDLVQSLSLQDQERNVAPTATSPPANQDSSDGFNDSGIGEDVEKKDFAKKPSAGLGDFGKIWESMGVPIPDIPTFKDSTNDASQHTVGIQDYTSDGATYIRPAKKKERHVTWEDQANYEDTTGGSAAELSTSPGSPQLTKKQLKRRMQKEKKAQEAAVLAAKNGVVSESEADNVLRKSPARKASAHSLAAEYNRTYNLRERNAAGQAITASPAPASSKTLLPASVAPVKAKSPTPERKKENSNATTPQPNKRAPLTRHTSQPATTTPVKHAQASAHFGPYGQPNTQWTTETPSRPKPNKLFPASVQPPKYKTPDPFASQMDAVQQAVQAVQAVTSPTPKHAKPAPSASKYATPAFSASKHAAPPMPAAPAVRPPAVSSQRPNAIEPKFRSGEDRHWALFLRLLNDHPQERSYLVSPMAMSNHSTDPNGIHVFVDASNIFIGFNDQLKRERNIPLKWHTDVANLSFDALALLMERRRPVAKRVLVGSLPEVPAFSKAREVGYEVGLLEKVFKAKELTDRQIYFRDREAQYKRRSGGKPSPAAAANTNGNTSGGEASGSETTGGPQYAPEKWIEQGVDEILHLKILESVVDSETPSTMVIATGDAAQAEYSSGFMAMAERALKKGWKVELVSWSKNISGLYMREEFRRRWGEMFKPVFLDNYAEELLDM